MVKRVDEPVDMQDGRDHWWHDLMEKADAECPCEPMDSEDLLYLLYTSGTTAKPKGIMHTTGGYLTQVAFTHKYVFDLHPDTDIYWCAADIGWVTGHSYIVYGPLTNGATSVIYEGAPDTPGTRPALGHRRALRRHDPLHRAHRHPDVHEVGRRRSRRSTTSRSSGCSAASASPSTPRRGCGTTTHIGGGRCPIVDTWWQTETGAIMISPLPGRHDPQARLGHVPAARASRPRSSTRPATGSTAAAATSPSPGRGRRCCAASTATPSATSETYWSKYGDRYFAGDGCKLDDDGYLWLLGRVDDVMNVSGHRISTTEVESALVDHPAVAEAAVVGANDAVTGQAIMAYVIARGTHTPSDELGEEVRQHVAKKLGAIARPKTVIFTDELPKTRSGKIMRRLLRDVAEGRSLGDTTTLADPNVVEEIKRRAAEAPTED